MINKLVVANSKLFAIVHKPFSNLKLKAREIKWRQNQAIVAAIIWRRSLCIQLLFLLILLDGAVNLQYYYCTINGVAYFPNAVRVDWYIDIAAEISRILSSSDFGPRSDFLYLSLNPVQLLSEITGYSWMIPSYLRLLP